ncbi:hypothetical protein T01_15484 [Trichinella spiralis]|uniref:Uncharacterized protein n=1 Tax=Trichinella spiralis TaxID=6334 RepID=A0A0V1BHY3_TRISP|nr:hypothetical protein T01_15484 [Trichinella spiralis]
MNNTLTCNRSFTKADIYMDDTYSFTNDYFGQFFEGVRHETMCNFSKEIKPICLMLKFSEKKNLTRLQESYSKRHWFL